MFVIPLKSTEEVEWGKILQKHLQKVYKNNQFDEECQIFSSLRSSTIPSKTRNRQSLVGSLRGFFPKRNSDLVSIDESLFRTVEAEETIREYLVQFHHLSSKISEKDLEVIFTWDKIKTKSWDFEKNAMLFNLGASIARKGADQDLDSIDGLKIAFNAFERASGVFSHPDLTNQYPEVKNLKWLMLAQAQECFYLKACKESKAESILARISHQAGLFYSRSELEVEKSAYFASLAQIYQASIDHQNSQFGNEICRLEWVVKNLPKNHKKLQKETAEKLKVCQKENSLIYHLEVPDFEALAPIHSFLGAKPKIFSLDIENSKSLFEELVSTEIQKSLEEYGQLKETLVGQQFILIEETIKKTLKKLEDLGLPAAIDALIEPVPLPQKIIDRNFKIRTEGGVDNLRKKLSAIDAISEKCFGLLNVERSHKELALVSALIKAKEINLKIRNDLAEGEVSISKLDTPLTKLQELVPSSSGRTDIPEKTILKNLLEKVEQLISQFSELKEEIKTISIYDDLTTVLLRDSTERRVIFQERLKEKYDPLNGHLNSLIKKQEELIKLIEENYRSFLIKKPQNVDTQSRESIFHQFDIGFNAYAQLSSAIEEGLDFHQKIEASVINVVGAIPKN